MQVCNRHLSSCQIWVLEKADTYVLYAEQCLFFWGAFSFLHLMQINICAHYKINQSSAEMYTNQYISLFYIFQWISGLHEKH